MLSHAYHTNYYRFKGRQCQSHYPRGGFPSRSIGSIWLDLARFCFASIPRYLIERFHLKVFFEVVVPLLGVSNTAVLGISTPLGEKTGITTLHCPLKLTFCETWLSGEDNYYSQLSSLQDENKRPLFKTMTISLVCDVCKKSDSSMLQCVHRLSQLPSWKSQANQEKVKRIMSTVPELFAREALGVVTSEKFGVFTPVQTKHLLHLPVSAINNQFPIFVVIDPTGGGSSKLALVTMGLTSSKQLSIVSNLP